MNTQKYKMNNSGLLAEADRSLYRDKQGKYKDTASRSLIDFDKSHMNYNLCPHPQYNKQQIKHYIENITHKTMRKDAVLFGSTIITLPKDYEGDSRKFFEASYKALKEVYGLEDSDIVCSWVHMDETSQHNHFYFIPHYRTKEKEGVSWEKVVPRSMYKMQHKRIEEYINQQPYFVNNGYKVNLRNGETLGIGDVNKLEKADKKAHKKRLEAQENELKEIKLNYIKNEIKPLESQITALQDEFNTLKSLYKSLVAWVNERLPKLEKLLNKALVKDTTHKVNDLRIELNKFNIKKAKAIDDELEQQWEEFKEDFFLKEKTL